MRTRHVVKLATLILLASFVTVYTGAAHFVALSVHEFGGTLYWSTPGYNFIPWPQTPTGIVPQLTNPLNQADLQFYHFLISSGVLVALTILLWVIVFLVCWRLRENTAGKNRNFD